MAGRKAARPAPQPWPRHVSERVVVVVGVGGDRTSALLPWPASLLSASDPEAHSLPSRLSAAIGRRRVTGLGELHPRSPRGRSWPGLRPGRIRPSRFRAAHRRGPRSARPAVLAIDSWCTAPAAARARARAAPGARALGARVPPKTPCEAECAPRGSTKSFKAAAGQERLPSRDSRCSRWRDSC